MEQTPVRNLPKHTRYAEQYRRFGYFWGLGIEHETYVATSQTRRITEFTAANMKSERYSVSYYKNYRASALKPALDAVIRRRGGALTVPVLMNCHSFTDCDVYGEHALTYERVPKPNPKYTGQTLFDWMCQHSTWLRNEKGRVFMWDGDTVEFMTQRFYCARVEDVLRELREGEARFVKELARMPRVGLLTAYAPLRLATPVNEPWATYLTNPRGISMFNNGTLHVNVTLPTRLGWNCQPLWFNDFVDRHRWLARLIQWWEPLWVAAYGSGDPLVEAGDVSGSLFAAGSQRLAVSRYIGLGTYDTVTMPAGKILQVPRSSVGPVPWYQDGGRGYEPLDVIGLDLNFNKHWAHGLELRFFDQMPEAGLREILLDLVVLMDCAQERLPVADPRTDVRWQRAATGALYDGEHWVVEPEYLAALCDAMRVPATPKEPMYLGAALELVRREAETRRGYCWDAMVGPPPPPSSCCCLWRQS
jgi:hypothetical protein